MATGPSAEFVSMIVDMLAPLADIRTRRMFGGVCFYGDGVAFALIADDTFYVKVDTDSVRRHEAQGLALFRPFAGKDTTLRYAAVPDGALEDPDEMLEWARPALAVARRAATVKTSRRPRASSR